MNKNIFSDEHHFQVECFINRLICRIWVLGNLGMIVGKNAFRVKDERDHKIIAQFLCLRTMPLVIPLVKHRRFCTSLFLVLSSPICWLEFSATILRFNTCGLLSERMYQINTASFKQRHYWYYRWNSTSLPQAVATI